MCTPPGQCYAAPHKANVGRKIDEDSVFFAHASLTMLEARLSIYGPPSRLHFLIGPDGTPGAKWPLTCFSKQPASGTVSMTTATPQHVCHTFLFAQIVASQQPTPLLPSCSVDCESQRRCQYRDDQVKMRRRVLLKSPQTLLGRISSHLTLWPPFRAYLHIEPELYYLLSSHFLRNLKPGPLKRHCRPAEK